MSVMVPVTVVFPGSDKDALVICSHVPEDRPALKDREHDQPAENDTARRHEGYEKWMVRMTCWPLIDEISGTAPWLGPQESNASVERSRPTPPGGSRTS